MCMTAVRSTSAKRRFIHRCLATAAGTTATAISLIAPAAFAQYQITAHVAGWADYHYNDGGVGSQFNQGVNSTASGTTDSTGLAKVVTGTVSGYSGGYPHAETYSQEQINISLPAGSLNTNEYDTGTNGIYTGDGGGYTVGSWTDQITLTAPGATSSTVTTLHVHFDEYGHMKPTGTDTAGAEAGTTLVYFSMNGAGVHTDIEFNRNHGDTSYVNAADGQAVTYSIVMPDFISGIADVSFTGPSATIPIYMQMQTSSNNGMDTNLTATISLELPSGVQMTSNSGVFPIYCPTDLNHDGITDLADLAQLLAHYGETSAPPVDGDVNGDHAVDLSDLATLLSNYGLACSH